MTQHAVTHELPLYGPQRRRAHAAVTQAAAEAYCRRLARGHYENFTVASLLLPRRLRRHFYHIYAYCRWSDDLADEMVDPKESLALLDWWEEQLRDCYRGVAHHPVFVALQETIREFAIPPEPFADLLVAFRQDQRVTRYATFDALLDYCRYSANPVGRLVLYLGRCHSDQTVALSNCICTGLQLANFCQDVANDWDRGRIYLPQDSCQAAGYDESMFARRQYNPAFRRLMQTQVARAEDWLQRGRALVDMVPSALRCDVALFVEGGLSILAAVRQIDYNVWQRRPRVSKARQMALLVQCWWRTRRRAAREAPQ